MNADEARRVYNLKTRNHDPLCPRWDLGGCFCDLIRQAQTRERDRLRKAVEALSSPLAPTGHGKWILRADVLALMDGDSHE